MEPQKRRFRSSATQKKNHASLCVVYSYKSGGHGGRTRNRLPGITFPVCAHDAEIPRNGVDFSEPAAPQIAQPIGDQDLAAVVNAWDELPPAVKAGIVAMVRSVNLARAEQR